MSRCLEHDCDGSQWLLWHGHGLYGELALGQGILLLGEKKVRVTRMKVSCRELCLLLQLSLNLSLGLHDELEHFIVASPRKHDLTRVQLKEGDRCGPYVDRSLKRTAKHDFWSSVKPAHEVLSRGRLIQSQTAPKITKLHSLGIFSDHDIVGFEVSMYKFHSVKVSESCK